MRVNRKSAIQVTTSATPADIDTIASGSISNSGKAVGAVNVCPGEMEQKRKTCHALTVTGYNPGRKPAIFACKYLSGWQPGAHSAYGHVRHPTDELFGQEIRIFRGKSCHRARRPINRDTQALRRIFPPYLHSEIVFPKKITHGHCTIIGFVPGTGAGIALTSSAFSGPMNSSNAATSPGSNV
jgi:hypothetical protein